MFFYEEKLDCMFLSKGQKHHLVAQLLWNEQTKGKYMSFNFVNSNLNYIKFGGKCI